MAALFPILVLFLSVPPSRAEAPRPLDAALIAAAYGNHAEAARLLIGAGANVNRRDGTRQSAYLISTSEGYVELLRLTLAAGADVNLADGNGVSPLAHARNRGFREIAALLEKGGAR